MGVPKFFRYMSERYPCLSEFVKEYQIPEFDNLYLDMNGIIHMCSHPDDSNPHFRITEEKLFSDIFHYIEVLFRMIKPQKVFFMAIDGVAPRAKMNQQRGRRFRSAKDAEKAEAEAKKKGEKLPDAARFDSNCITPGTEFMDKLHQQLKYFVVTKISSDSMWKKCKVILSGHETPGEGEHKIMDYIRYIRAQPGYDPNTRHCLYGLDADLIMLGLCTHDPHFSLLREEVKFGRKSTKRNNVPEEIRFYLLHLSLMREYLELEFAAVKEELEKIDSFKFDIEKIIDDWVLMGFLVGNDFIPHLPNLHITNGALPQLYKAYMKVLPTLDGYINESGTLNLGRFETFMTELSSMDVEAFEETKEDLMYMEAKTGRKQTAHARVSTKTASFDDADEEVDCLEKTRPKMDSGLEALIKQTDDLLMESSNDESSSEDEFKSFKDEYYRNKLEYQNVTKEVMRDQAEGYVRAIQWNLNYYYNGVCSWSWYYPHHYAPYISDIKGFSNLKIEFELGRPFKPYEQLLAVLPAASKTLLPKCYHGLMTDEDSLIKQYYPEEFQTDLNGKRQEWEAVVLVPFIDETKLLEAMEPCNAHLSLEEIKRNTHGPMLVYHYDDNVLGPYKAPDYFPTIIDNHAHCTPLLIEDLRIDKDKLVKGAYPGACFDVFYPGFPTMKHLKYSGVLKKAKVKVFESPSREQNMVLTITQDQKSDDSDDFMPLDLLDKNVFVGWPHLIEAKVVAISNEKNKYLPSDSEKKCSIEPNSSAQFSSELEGVTQQYMNRMGVDFGKTSVMVHVKTMVGRRYIFTANGRVNLEKQFSLAVSNFPLQGVIRDINVYDSFHSTFREISELFPVDSSCFTLSNPHYGSMGTIMDSTEALKLGKLSVSLSVFQEPDFADLLDSEGNSKSPYYTRNQAASQCAISNNVFSRVTGSLFVNTRNAEGNTKSVNLGLDLKFNKKNQETPGYTKKIDNYWYYTSQSVDLVRDYIDKFPLMFDYLTEQSYDNRNAYSDKNAENKNPNALEIFGDDGDDDAQNIQTWLKSLPIHTIERRVCNSSVLEPEIVKKIEKIVDDLDKKQPAKTIVMQLRPQLLYKPEIQMGNLPPDPYVKTEVYDRVVNIREGFTVPLGLKGTVIAIHKPSNAATDSDEMYDIVFDSVFTGGLALNCSENRGYRLHKTAFINLSYGRRRMEEKTGKPGALRAQAKANQNSNSFRVNAPYINGRSQQNSAFAPVYSAQPAPNHYGKNNYQHGPALPFFQPFRPQQGRPVQSPQQARPVQSPQQMPMYNQNKANKGPNKYDFMPTYGPKTNKENSANQGSQPQVKDADVRKNKEVVQKPAETKSKIQVDTDYLKRLLNISNSPPKPNLPSTNSASLQNQAGPSQNRSGTSATAQLMSYYQTNGLGCPRYLYLDTRPGFYSAQVMVPNRGLTTGKEAKSREEASENVAKDVLKQLQDGIKMKQGPPPAFPVPPVVWVMPHSSPNKNQGQGFMSRNHHQQQQQQGGYHYNQVRPSGYNHNQRGGNLDFNATRKPGGPVMGQKASGNVANPTSSSFVPLQAIIKQGSRSSGGKTATTGSALRKDDKDEIKIKSREFVGKGHSQTSKQTEKSKRQRKTRIAANFVVDKS